MKMTVNDIPLSAWKELKRFDHDHVYYCTDYYYDLPLKGVCCVDGVMYRFEINDGIALENLYPLEKVVWIVRKNFQSIFRGR